MGCILHGRHGHSHGAVYAEENINVRAAVIHVLGDLIQSTGVFISALVIKFYVSKKSNGLLNHVDNTISL